MESNLFLLSTQFPDCNIYVALSHTSAFVGILMLIWVTNAMLKLGKDEQT